LAILRLAAKLATAPASRAEEFRHETTLVQTTVTSQTAGLPARHGWRDECHTVWTFSACATETGWLFGHWNASCGECSGNHVGKSVVSSSFAQCLLTDKAVQATGVYRSGIDAGRRG